MMIHPSADALERYADALSSHRSPRIRRHLERCERCRSVVQFRRKLEAAVGTLGGPKAGAHLEGRIRVRLQSGERLLLPMAQARAQRSMIGRRSAVAAAVLVTITAFAFWPTDKIAAGSITGELRFDSPGLVYDRPIAVEYRAGQLLRGAPSVVLRARLRSRFSDSYNMDARQIRMDTLEHVGDGLYRGSIRFGDSVVYAVFAVETPDGSKIDDNGLALWNLFRLQDNGRPTFHSVEQRWRDLLGENPELALEAIRERTKLFPEHPDVWAAVYGFERFMLGQQHADSARAGHRERLLRLHERYAAGGAVSLDISWGMSSYAVQIANGRDTVVRNIGRFWRARTFADSSRHPIRDQIRVFGVGDTARLNADRGLMLYEQLWPEIGWRVTFLATNAYAFATGAQDHSARVRWADRIVTWRPSSAGYYYGELAKVSETRRQALARIRVAIRRPEALSDSLRPLETPVPEWQRTVRESGAGLHAILGEALVADGNVRGGLDTLSIAARSRWDPGLFRQAAEAHLTVGDTVGAARYLSMVAVDPNSVAGFADSVRTLHASVAASTWDSLLAEARHEMTERVLEAAITRPVDGSARLVSSTGLSTTLDAVRADQPAVVTFWSRHCGPSRFQMERLPRLADEIRRHGGILIAITSEQPSAELAAALAEMKVTIPVYHDRWAEAKREFGQYATPEYHVLDAAGRLRFTRTSIDQAVVQMAVL